MAPPGGAATAYGILYQLLGSVHRVVRLSVQAGDLGDAGSPTLVIIEPSGGGGDLREDDPGGHRVAIQFKTRSTGRPWSLTGVIVEVLPDLYKAVDDHRLALPDEYHFVTEGRIGAWEEASKFFVGLAPGAPPDDPLSELSATTLVKTAPGTSISHRELFERIVEAIRTATIDESGRAAARIGEPIETTRRKVWHLIRGLRFEPRTLQQLTEAIDRRLRPIVEPGEAVEDVRGRLLVKLLEISAAGNASIVPEELLASARVTLAPLKAFAQLRARLHELVGRHAALQGYRSDADVRTPMTWEQSRILLLAGDSGNGKSWAQCGLARRGLDDGIVAIKTASGSGTDTWARAVTTLWQSVGFEGTGSLEALLTRVRASDAQIRPQHVDVHVDNVQDSGEARYLIDRTLDEHGDVRLTLTVPLRLGQSLKNVFGDRVRLVEIGHFSDDEFESFCELRALDWRRIPFALRPALRRPLLAEIYAREVGTEADRYRPQSEYEVFDVYWRRVTDLPEQHAHPGDAGVLANLAANTVLTRRPLTAWTQMELRQHGADDAWQMRVQRVGWLQRSGEDVRIWHDRLFGWAAAKGIVAQHRAGVLSAGALSQLLRSSAAQIGSGSLTSTLVLDVLWLLLEPHAHVSTELVSTLLDDIENVLEVHRLHELLLPRLGPRIIGALVERLRRQSSDAHRSDRAARYAAATLVKIGRHHPSEVATEAGRLIHDSSPVLQKAGVIVLGTVQNRAALDRLWTLHRDNVSDLANRHAGAAHSYLLTMMAMRTCLEANASWLPVKIRDADPTTEPTQELAYLLAGLKATEAESIWEDCKAVLLERVPDAKARALVACIHRFRDIRELDRLRHWMDIGDHIHRAFTLRALTAVAPDEAFAMVARLPADVLTFARGFWLPTFLHDRREAMQRAIRNRMTSNLNEFWPLALAYTGMEQELDAETVALMLDRLEADLASDETCPHETAGVHHALRLLSQVWHLEALSVFEARRGRPLGVLLAKEVDARARRQTVSKDHDLEDARRILLKIGGESVAALAATELAHDLTMVKKSGIRAAIIHPTDALRRALRDLARAPNADGDHAVEALAEYAIVALAALGEERWVLEAMMQRGRTSLTTTLVEVRKRSRPFDDELVAVLLTLLQDEAVDQRDRAVRIAAISRRPELIDAVRAMLMQAPVGSLLAFDAILTLHLLDGHSSETIPALSAHLSSEREQEFAADALIRIGTPDAIAILRHAVRIDLRLGQGFRLRLLTDLVMLTNDRAAARQLWEVLQPLPTNIFPAASMLMALAASEMPDVERCLRDLVFGPDHPQLQSDPTLRAAGIRALARLSSDDALAAAEWAFTEGAVGREHVLDAILDINADAAVDMVLRVAPLMEPEERWAASRVLRLRLDSVQATMLEQRVADMLTRSNPLEREAAADVARFLRAGSLLPRLQHLELEDHQPRVQQAARESARAQKREMQATALAAVLVPTDAGAWAKLHGIVALCDPDVLMDGAASVISDDLYRQFDPAMRQVLDEWMTNRRHEVERELRQVASTRRNNH